MTNVAVIGAGLIGRAWSIVFARAGFQVSLWDQFPLQVTQALAFIGDRLPELRAAGLLAEEPSAVLPRIKPMQSLWETVRDAEYIQENGPERVDIKRPLFAELERAARADAVIASSSSGIPASAFTEDLKTRQRCLDRPPGQPALSGARWWRFVRRHGPIPRWWNAHARSCCRPDRSRRR